MTQPNNFSGGQTVKASTLIAGDFVRDPKKGERILVICETGATIFGRGYSKDDVKYHHFFSPNDMICKVTNVTTENIIPVKEGTGQE
jgi:hypothetical protein